jgi:hypothetical protein
MQTITDPIKIKAAAAYNSAADHVDDETLGVWAKYGLRTVERPALSIRATVDQLEPAVAERLHDANLAWIRSHHVASIETNVIYAVARKR